ncbi:peptidylprolyl isomerase [Isobaculum melis]
MKYILILIIIVCIGVFSYLWFNQSDETTKKTASNNDTTQQQERQQTAVEEKQIKNPDGSLYYPQLSNTIQSNEIEVEMVTTMGAIKLKLFPDLAPKAVENFVTLSKDGYYNGIAFHRVIADFMIQGGDPEGTGRGGKSTWGKPFEDEFSKQAVNIRGALSMANAGPNTNGSQFFIVQNQHARLDQINSSYPKELTDLYKNGGTPHLDGAHTVFGQVIEGMAIVDQIAAVEVDDQDKPVTPVVIEKINILTDQTK